MGFSLVFIGMGASASAIGQFLFRHAKIVQLIGGIIVIFFGLHFIGIFTIPILYKEKRIYLQKRPSNILGAFIVGVAFAIGWTPCIGPVLGSILTYASTKETVSEGITLLAGYSIGLAIPFIITGFAIGMSFKIIKRIKRYLPIISLGSAILLIIMGILIITDSLKLLFFI
jgi:cytochrome c-type biogenesis protein